MADVIYLVGAAQTYATIADAQAALPSNLGTDRHIIRVMDSGTIDGGASPAISIGTAKTWGSGAEVIIEADDSVHHDQGVGGVLLTSAAQQVIAVTAGVTSGTAKYTFKGFRIEHTNTGNASRMLQLQNASTSRIEVRFTECHVIKTGATGTNYDVCFLNTAYSNRAITLDNCRVIDAGTGNAVRTHIRLNAGSGTLSDIAFTAYNCEFVGGGTGILMATGPTYTNATITTRNVVFLNVTTPVSAGTGVTADRDYEAHTGTGTSGSNSVNSVSATTGYDANFVRDAADSDLDDTGETLGATYARDLNGFVRSGDWSLGAFEFVNDAPPVITSVLPADNSSYLEGASVSFSATITDDVGVSGISWESDLDGEIGTTASFSRSNLSVGDHHITITATDSAAQETTYEFDITISAVLASITAADTAYSEQEGIPIAASVQLGPGRSATSYLWEQTAGTTATIGDDEAASTVLAMPKSTTGSTLTFRLTVTVTGGYSVQATKNISLVFGRQSVIYAVMRALQRSEARALTVPHVGGGVQDYLYGFPRGYFTNGRYDTDGGEVIDGCIGSSIGTGHPPVLAAWALLYKELGIKDIGRHLIKLARTAGLCQDACADGWSEDMGVDYTTGEIIAGTKSTVGGQPRFITTVAFENCLLNDDGCSQLMWHALILAAEAFYEHDDPEWTEVAGYVLRYYHRFLVGCTTYTIVEGDFPNEDRPVSVGSTPWASGAFPEMWPAAKAFGGFHQFGNWPGPESTWPNDFNPNGAYGWTMPFNDAGVSAMIRALVALYLFAKHVEDEDDALPAFDSVSYTAANILTRLEALVDCALDSYDTNGGVVAQVHPITGEAEYGRPKEPPAKLWGEHDFFGAMACVYRLVPDLDSALRGRIWTTGTPPTGVLQDYADRLRNMPAAHATTVASNGVLSANAPWLPDTAYSVGAIRYSNPPGPFAFQVTTAGTSGASEPTWNDTVGATTADGPDTLVWTCIYNTFNKSIWRNTASLADPNIGETVNGVVVAEDTPMFATRAGVVYYGSDNYCFGDDPTGIDQFGASCSPNSAGEGQGWCQRYDCGQHDEMTDSTNSDRVPDPDVSFANANPDINNFLTLSIPAERLVFGTIAVKTWPTSAATCLNAYLDQAADGSWWTSGTFLPGSQLALPLWRLYHLLTDYAVHFNATFSGDVVDSDGDGVNDNADAYPLDAQKYSDPPVSRAKVTKVVGGADVAVSGQKTTVIGARGAGVEGKGGSADVTRG